MGLGRGLDRGLELLNHGFTGAATFDDVALEAAFESDVVVDVDEDGEVDDGVERGVAESKETFQNDVGRGGEELRVIGAGVGGEVVLG